MFNINLNTIMNIQVLVGCNIFRMLLERAITFFILLSRWLAFYLLPTGYVLRYCFTRLSTLSERSCHQTAHALELIQHDHLHLSGQGQMMGHMSGFAASPVYIYLLLQSTCSCRLIKGALEPAKEDPADQAQIFSRLCSMPPELR